MKIIENNEDWHILDSALQKISDEKLLADIAKNNSDWRIRRYAVKKIEDEIDIILGEEALKHLRENPKTYSLEEVEKMLKL